MRIVESQAKLEWGLNESATVPQFAAVRSEPRSSRPKLTAEERRWRSQVITAPVEALVRAAAYTQPEPIDQGHVDLRRLAQRTIDLVVASMGISRDITEDAVIDALTAFAEQMSPDITTKDGRYAAEFVYRHLLNAPDDFARFTFVGVSDDGVPRPFTFDLLKLEPTEDGIGVRASDEAINVFLSALDLDATDTEAAIAVMLERQLADGRLDAARVSAEAAGETSRRVAASISILIEDIGRDVTSIDWGELRDQVSAARRHISARIVDDNRLLEHAASGLDAEEAEIRSESGRIIELLEGCKTLHLDLQQRILPVHRRFLSAQGEQRLARRPRLRLLSIRTQLFEPVLAMPTDSARIVTDAFVTTALGIRGPRLARLSDLIDGLLAPPRNLVPHEVDAEVPAADDGAVDPQRYSDATVAAAHEILEHARLKPCHLSELLVLARARQDPELVDLVVLTSLWAFAPEDDPEEIGRGTEIDLTSGLEALDIGRQLLDADYAGTDLLVGSPESLRALTEVAPEPPAMTPQLISIDRYRRGKK
jgi:hypothetical protein